MYNLTVDAAHTFFVGDGAWLVHNACIVRETLDQLRSKYTIPQERWDHAYDSHAHEWFGTIDVPARTQSNVDVWNDLIERATRSNEAFEWSTRGQATIAHLTTFEGKPFVVQFFIGGSMDGLLATAFIPNSAQLQVMREILGYFD